MRIHLTLTRNQSLVPYDHLPVLVGTLHKWLGQNEWHNQLSFHSFSWLRRGSTGNNGLLFRSGAEWFISSYHREFMKRLIAGIQNDPKINYGLTVTSITVQEDPTFAESHTFTVASPVLIKRTQGQRIKHYVFSDNQSGDLLTETLMTKLNKAGLNSAGVRIAFDQSYSRPKTKLVNYNGIQNRASFCPVTVQGTPEQIAFAWNVGIGNSTGIGFGALN